MAAEDYFDFWPSYELEEQYYGPTNPEEEWEMGHYCPGTKVLRQNKATKEYFYGCSKFPECCHTMKYRG